MKYNIYCDESCHLEHDNSNAMTLGAIWCPNNKVPAINKRINEIKANNSIGRCAEMKWNKLTPNKVGAYLDLIDYFFDDDDLHCRCIVIPNKELLDHTSFNQTHDDWYYKMYFEMLKAVFAPKEEYELYIDIKDKNSHKKAQKLGDVCANSILDFSHNIVQRIQPIRSEEVAIMQIVDILTGAVCYENRHFPVGHTPSSAKIQAIERIKDRSRYSLKKTTLLKEDKFNLFVWEAQRYV